MLVTKDRDSHLIETESFMEEYGRLIFVIVLLKY